MDDPVHQWVESFNEFEAVLHSLKPLGGFDADMVVRAFQTFHWDDATLPGEDLTFAHSSAAVMIRYDGEVLGINFGNGKLNDAFPDMFAALHALGWTQTEVYHPAESMSALLADMGKAIPAYMQDFDVQPAKRVTEVSSFAESASLLKVGAMGSGGASSDVFMRELESMAPVAALPVLGLLDDDLPDDESLDVAVAVAGRGDVVAGMAMSPGVSPAPAFDDEFKSNYFDEPVVPVAAEDAVALSEAQAGLLIENEHLRESLANAHERLTVEQAEMRRLRDAVVVSKEVVMGSVSQVLPLVEVGVSAIGFDLPGARVSDAEVLDWAREYGVDGVKVVHVRPGSIGESVRWDVFGDVDADHPASVQLLACAMGFEGARAVLVASLLLELKSTVAFAQLRDVLAVCASSGSDTKVKMDRLVDAAVSPGLKLLFSRLGAVELTQVLDEVVLRLGGLLLCPVGSGFVDVRESANDLAASMSKTFCVRELRQSAVPQLFMVHVDALDGPFVSWVAELLRSVAAVYAVSERYVVPSVEPVALAAVAPVEPVADLAQVKTMLADLMKKLSDVGISV